MQVRRFDSPEMQRVLEGIFCGAVLPEREGSPAPFKAIWVRMEKGRDTPRHRHHEEEIFVVTQGLGLATSGGEEVEVRAGDVLFFPPLHHHTIRSIGEEDLVFLDIYWENMKNTHTEGLDDAGKENRSQRVLVYGAPPTVNGDLHLGHLSGPYLSADIHTRYRRMAGDDAHLVIGMDCSQIYVKDRARRMGVPASELVETCGGLVKETLEMAHLGLSDFYYPLERSEHRQLVEQMVRDLYGKGELVSKEAPALVCPSCDLYLFEVYVAGSCPHCGEDTYGNGCEECGQPNDCVDLGNPTCRVCGETPEQRMVERLYFPLEPHRQRLEEHLAKVELRTQQRSLCREALKGPLPDVVCSHVTEWGIPVPVDGFEGQCISSWVEAVLMYLTSSDDLGRKVSGDQGWETFWKEENSEVVQFFGIDNCWVHTIFIPALFSALDSDIRLPVSQVGNQFLRLNGEKFSTSRNHAIWGRDLIEATSADVVRFYLAYSSPETESGNFQVEEFETCVRRELVEGCQGWLRDLGSRLAVDFPDGAPEPGEWTEEHIQFLAEARHLVRRIELAYQAGSFSPQRAARAVCELVRVARSFGQAQAGWRGAPETQSYLRSGIALELAAAKALCWASAPLMPEFATRLWRDLGFIKPLEDQRWEAELSFLPEGQKASALDSIYFPLPGPISSLKELEAVPVEG